MKKVLAVFLALIMIFSCACQKGNGNNDKNSAIAPVSEEEQLKLHDGGTNQDFDLHRITTDSYKNAQELLDGAIDYMSTLGIGAKIKAMYAIHMGIASEYEEVFPIKIVFEDENIAPIFLVLLKDMRRYTAGMSFMGSFRDTDVADEKYFDKVIEIADLYDAKLKKNLGLLRDDINVCFPIRMTRNLAFSMSSSNTEILLEDTMTIFNKYSLAMWSSELSETDTLSENGMYYQKLESNVIKSLKDLETYLGTAFTKRNTEEIINTLGLDSGDSPVYIERNDSLYVMAIGMGGPMGLKSIKPKYVAYQEDARMFVIAEATWVDFDDDFKETGTRYTEHLFVFEKDEQGDWKCDFYDDISFGRFTSSYSDDGSAQSGPVIPITPDKPEPPKIDKKDAIKPLEADEKLSLYDKPLDTYFPMFHIDTKANEDAEDYLNLCYAYLESLGIGAQIKAMYAIPMGIANEYHDTFPVKIIFTDEAVAPIYLVILRDNIEYTKGISCIGSFRDDDVSNEEYFNKVIAIDDALVTKLNAAIGSGGSEYNIFFPIKMTANLKFSAPSEADTKLFENAANVYFKYAFASWYDTLSEDATYINGNYYQKLTHPDIKTIADFDTFLGKAFTAKVTTEIKDMAGMTEGSYPIYVEQDGAVYIAPMGMGGPEGLESVKPKFVAVKDDSTLFMVVEATWHELDDDWNPISTYYSDHLYVFVKDDGGAWKCDRYEDIPFGRYTTML